MAALRATIRAVVEADAPMTVRQIFYRLVGLGAVEKTDTRARNFEGESVELDAIPPKQLRKIVEAVILRHVDPQRLAVLKVAEESERDILKFTAENIRV